MRTVIIDDEENARQTIAKMIDQECDDVKVVAEADSIKSGIDVLNSYQPDVVLLDIQLPDGTGFDLLDEIDSHDFKLIFITAFEEYAVKAFKFSAIDYLLKPFDPDEVKKAFVRAREALDKEDTQLKLNAFLSNIENISKEVKKIVLKTSESIHLVNVQDIIRCQSDCNYTNFYLYGGKKLIVSKTLKEYDNMLSSYGFYRIHQSHLVNLNYMDYFNKENERIVLKDGSEVPVSHRKKDQLIKIFNEL
jgi:two-component system LytT family response regulator